jgi:cellulose synthase/poly-beta-1,6-N-acetylglucosamine synthase-like glycosyltransferase
MSFDYTPWPQERPARLAQRLLDMVPGLASWTIILGLAFTSLVFPIVGAGLLVAFLYYYVFRISYVAIFLMLGFFQLWVERNTDWMERIRDFYDPPEAPRHVSGLRTRISQRRHWRNIRAMVEESSGEPLPNVEDLVHVVLIPVLREPRSVYEETIRAVAASELDSRSRIVVALGVEERGGAEVLETCRQVQADWRERFVDFLVIVHPDGLPGEIPGKASNDTYAAKQIVDWLEKRDTDLRHVILSCLDSDTVVPPSYFACLTYAFLACPERLRASFQPIPVFDKNLWSVPAPVRIAELSTTVVQMIESTNMDWLVSFSSHSISLHALREAGYWPVDMIAEDAAGYWQRYVHFRGDYRVVPIPVAISMDAPEGDSFLETLKISYKQKRRWAFGAENVAVALRGLSTARGLALGRKLMCAVKLVDNYVTWATWAIILNLIIWLPRLGARLSGSSALVVFNFQRLSGTVFSLSGVYLVLLVLISLGIATHRAQPRAPLWRLLLHPLEWLLFLPVTSLFLGSLPALDAQTRLMLGKRLGYFPVPHKEKTQA